jgi:hypothetical protein
MPQRGQREPQVDRLASREVGLERPGFSHPASA